MQHEQMHLKDFEKDLKDLTALGKELFGKTQVLITKIAKEMQKDAMKRLNEFKDNFEKTMKMLFKAETKSHTPEKVTIT